MNRILLLLSLQTFSSPSLAAVAGAAALIQELLCSFLHLLFPLGWGLAVAVPICPLQIGFQGWGGEGGCDGLVWNMGNKEMKSQGTIRPEVSLSLTFTSMGDDIQEIYMGSGRIMNGEEEEPPECCAWGAGSPGPAAEQGLCGHVEVYLGDRDKCWHLLGCTADAVQGTSPVWVRKWE